MSSVTAPSACDIVQVMLPTSPNSSGPASPAPAADPAPASPTLTSPQFELSSSTSSTTDPLPHLDATDSSSEPASSSDTTASITNIEVSSTTQNVVDAPARSISAKFKKLLAWMRKDWVMKVLAVLALVWAMRAFNEQVRGNTLNEMEACRSHPVRFLKVRLQRLTCTERPSVTKHASMRGDAKSKRLRSSCPKAR